MSQISQILSAPPANFSTTLSANITSSDLTIPLNGVTGLGTEGVGVIYAKDSDGNPIVASIEFIHWTNITGNNLTLSDTGDRGISGSASGAQAHNSGDTFEVWIHPAYYFRDFAQVEHNDDGTHKAFDPTVTSGINDANGNEAIKLPATASAVNEVTIKNAATGNAPEIQATGDDTNIDLKLLPKGTGVLSVAGTTDYEDSVTDDDDIPNKAYVDANAGSPDGWTPSSDTWVYVSASSFKIEGVDRTSVYTKGTRLKFTQSATVKYGVVVGVSFSTDTTVTIAVNNDYTIANAAISDPYYSYQASPQGYPTWFAYSPSWTGFSSAPVVDVLFKIEGRSITLYFRTDGTSNSATFDFTLPVAPICVNTGGYDPHMIGVIDNAAGQNGPGVIGLNDGNLTAKVGKTFSSFGANAYGGFSASNPKGLVGTITYQF